MNLSTEIKQIFLFLRTFIKKLKPDMTALYYITAETGSRQLSKCPFLA